MVSKKNPSRYWQFNEDGTIVRFPNLTKLQTFIYWEFKKKISKQKEQPKAKNAPLEDFQWVELSKINPKDVSTDFATQFYKPWVDRANVISEKIVCLAV